MTKRKLEEPLLNFSEDRLILFPIKHLDLWELYKKSIRVFWTVEELDFEKDYRDFSTLNDSEQHFLKYILAFFAASDTIVNENLMTKFFKEVQYPEAKAFYGFQIMMETVHSETYGLLIESLIKTEIEKQYLFNAIQNIPCIKSKAQWALRWMNSSRSFAHRLIAFACIEGIHFSGAFCSIYYFKKRGLMPGLCVSNEFISRDEGIHTDFACLLYRNHIINKLSQSDIEVIIDEAVIIEHEFINNAIPCRLLGMNADLMTQYIKFVADRLLVSLGYKNKYHTENPFDFMEMISLQGKTNFFEKVVSDYSRGTDMKTFSTDDEF